RGAVASPSVELRHPLRSAAGLFRSRWWTIGFAIAFVAWTLHVAALAVAPLSLVETTISGGLVLLAWLAERWFGVRVGVREWLGLALCAVGLALLAATSAGAGGSSSRYSVEAMVTFEAAAIGTGALLLLSGSAGTVRRTSGPLLGAAAGLPLGDARGEARALDDLHHPRDVLVGERRLLREAPRGRAADGYPVGLEPATELGAADLLAGGGAAHAAPRTVAGGPEGALHRTLPSR